MAKRFTDTDKWKKPFIRSMKAPYKLLWLYILDECDHAGIWHVDIEVAEIRIGEKLKIETAIEFFKDKIFVFDEETKWFIPDFIKFQYGELKTENRAHNSVIQILEKYRLINEDKEVVSPLRTYNKPLISPLQGAMDKEKDKDMVKDMDKDKDKDAKLKTEKVEYPFSEEFKYLWHQWKEYKKVEHKFNYKSEQSEQAAINELVKLAEGIEENAVAIINQSLSKGWKGFFQLKNEQNGKLFTGNNKSNSGITAEQLNQAHAKYFGG